ncbi:cobalamin biosynthesis protein CobD [Bacillus methanolicus]|uniref:adenosylcobinamide-phosphate synthase CbiB n=1 Tax=Bacillus methanolicus TaxID=1471 RepID=UPI002380364B|nr:adenosylcobinamide-phosphate synthase CbiB [Bacillus methanolicus]MDE3840690.1 cobalamin biosynthesis protein CobD [Bacillus methanolicus]
MIIHHLAAVILAFFLDLIIGDPPGWPHPVRWMGALIAFLDKKLNKGNHRLAKGVVMLFAVLLIVMGVTGISVFAVYQLHPLAGIVWEGVLISTAIAQKSLREAALAVYEPLQNGNIAEARVKLSYIVGRDTDHLPEREIVRGTVETVAENTSDGVTAPLFWGMLGGAVFALAYRAVNTCDSMVGYLNQKYERFGFASAKLDDLLNWLPSRLTAIAMLLSMKPKKVSRKKAVSIVLRDAKKHPSPNSGWGEAAFAAIFGIQLGGTNYYNGVVSHRAKMGDPKFELQTNHIIDSINLMKRSAFLFLLFLCLGGVAFEMAVAWF